MKHIFSVLTVCSLLAHSFISHGQNAPAIPFPAGFKLDAATLLPGYILTPVNAEMRQEGITGNPGISGSTGLKQSVCERCDPGMTTQVYYEIYHSKKDKGDDAGVFVLAFKSEELLESALGQLEGQSNYTFMTAENYLIKIWSDDGRMGSQHIAGIAAYYKKKLNAREYKATERQVPTDMAMPAEATEAEPMAEEPVAAMPAADAEAAAGDIPVPALSAMEAETDAVAPAIDERSEQADIPVKAGRRIKYLYFANGGLIGFFDDGTVSGCPQCDLCRQSIATLKKQKPYAQYTVDNDMIVIAEPSSGDGATDAAGIRLHHNEESEEWAILNYKEIVTINTCE